MFKIAFALLFFICTVARAQTDRRHFARYNVLTSAFPEAFTEYTNLDYLIPTYAPEWGNLIGGGRRLTIKAWLTPLGLSNRALNHLVPEISLSIEPVDGSTVTIDEAKIHSIFPPSYAWRVALAELLLQYPNTLKIVFSNISDFANPDLGQCAELLARGIDSHLVAQRMPMSEAMYKLGFDVETFAPLREPARDLDSAHWYGEIELNTTFIRMDVTP